MTKLQKVIKKKESNYVPAMSTVSIFYNYSCERIITEERTKLMKKNDDCVKLSKEEKK